jgi:hypothetical protein
MSLLITLQSEILKTKRTAAFYFTLVGAAIVPCTFLANVGMDGMEDIKKDHFNGVFKLSAEMNGLVFFPLFVVLICTLLPQIEYKNNTWKQLVTSPQSKANIFLAKFLNIHLLMLLFMVATHVFLFIAAVIVHFMLPDINLLQQPLNVQKILVNGANTYVTVLALSTIQFWLGLRFKNFIVPTGVGLGLWLIGTIMVFEYHWTLANYFPYSMHIFAVFPKMKTQLNQVEWTSACYAAVFLVIGFFDFKRRRLNV